MVANPLFAQTDNGEEPTSSKLWFVLTDSPHSTLQSFADILPLLENALLQYQTEQTLENFLEVQLLSRQLSSLFDLSEVPKASQLYVGIETVAALADIFAVIGVPDPALAPSRPNEGFSEGQAYVLPGTPFRIAEVSEGPRRGEFLFDARTIDTAAAFLDQLGDEQKKWSLVVMQVTGPILPFGIVRNLPNWLQKPIMGTLLWKVLFALVSTAVSIFIVLRLSRWKLRSTRLQEANGLVGRMFIPLSALILALSLVHILSFQLNLSGTFARTFESSMTALVFTISAWIAWILILWIVDVLLIGKKGTIQSLDASMLKLAGKLIAGILVVVILANGAATLGVPVFSVLAGLGIGGLAVALAIRPTLENLIGGFILFLDKPIRVGDYCGFSGQTGFVEEIGPRSIKIRGLDRTLISVPNAQFADLQLVNWAECDEMKIEQTIGLRYETSHDQLLFILAEIRAMCHSHPKINSESVRVRFIKYGDSSLDITVRIYAMTREWNEFFAIQEDILTRIKQIVESSGSGFAFPSQTLYLSKDAGLDQDLSSKAVEKVSQWRKKGQLPFPKFAQSTLDRLNGTLAYPPVGSPHAQKVEQSKNEEESAERLSSPDLEKPEVEASEAEKPDSTRSGSG